MDNRQLPAELEALQRELRERQPTHLPADLRGRVIGGVRAELARERSRGQWTFAAAVAAAAVIWINLSISATQSTDFGLDFRGEPPSVETVAEQIQRTLPEISRREALRQAVLLRAGSQLVCYPAVSGRPTSRARMKTLDRLLNNGA